MIKRTTAIYEVKCNFCGNWFMVEGLVPTYVNNGIIKAACTKCKYTYDGAMRNMGVAVVMMNIDDIPEAKGTERW